MSDRGRALNTVFALAVSIGLMLVLFGYARTRRPALAVHVTAPAPAQATADTTRRDTSAILERPSPDMTLIVHGDTIIWIFGRTRMVKGTPDSSRDTVRVTPRGGPERAAFVSRVLVVGDSVFALLDGGKRVPVDSARARMMRNLLMVVRRDATLRRLPP